MTCSARKWRAFADSRAIVAERRRRWPGSEPIRGRATCGCGQSVGRLTLMCADCHRDGWAWVAEVYAEQGQGR